MHVSLTEFHMEDAAIERFGLAALRDYLLPRLLSGRVATLSESIVEDTAIDQWSLSP